MTIDAIDKKQLAFDRGKLSNTELLDIYEHILRPRLIEEKMLSMLRQGKISKWFSGIGQEAVAVGTALAMHPDEYILPMHRNLGTFTSRGIPMARLFSQFQGRANGFTKGRALLQANGLVSLSEIADGKSQDKPKSLKRVLAADQVKATLARGPPTSPEAAHPRHSRCST